MGQNLSSDYLSLFEIHQSSELCEIVASQGRRDLSSISSAAAATEIRKVAAVAKVNEGSKERREGRSEVSMRREQLRVRKMFYPHIKRKTFYNLLSYIRFTLDYS